MKYWNETYECMKREELSRVQLERLHSTVSHVYKNVPFYRGKMQKAGVTPADIRTLDDLKKLPFTTKQDLRDNYPFGLFAVPQSEVVRVHASSGTTGKPIVVGYTHKDVDTWSELIARCLVAAGADRNSVVQVAYGYGLFTGGLGLHYGVERLGATVIPMSGGNTQKQLMLMKDFGSTLLACTPSYALYLAEEMDREGIKPEELMLRYGVFGAEPWTEGMRKQIENRLGIRASDIYGLSEVMGPGVAIECEQQNGLHVFEDHFIPEIIDPDTGVQLPYGTTGELAFTSLTKEAFPVIRYRTRDLTYLDDARCSCGRTHVRMGRIMGRCDDMLIIRGVNVFPTQVESVLTKYSDVEPHYLLVVNRQGTLDTLEVRIEMSERLFSDEVRKVEEVRRRIAADIESVLGMSITLKLVEPKSIERSQGKAKRVLDNRKLV
ncbi:MAG: phenylacetate--CoA ligase [Eubacteriales bacterium]|nr:phenylacetate--CoA ligase [Eubacteriales bacterium]